MRSDMAAAAFVLVALAATIASLPAAESAVPTVDLGSEWLKVTIVNRKPGQPPISVAINEMSKRKSPAVVAFSSGLRLLGEEAAGIVARYPDKVYSQVRDMVGKPRGYVEELAAAAYLPLDLVEDARGAATIRADDGNGTVYSMEELLAMMAGIKEKPQLMMNHPHLEMGSLGRRSENEFDDEDLFSPVSLVRKAQSPGRSQGPPYSAAHQVGYPPKDLMTTMLRSLKIVVFTSKINLMLPFGPAAIFVAKFYEHPGLVFLLSLLGIIPLAERLGFATEQLAFFTGATVGGLLNATFGNATELIISILALKSGMIRVVQQSLLGSILSNMLLVLGCAFFSGGLVFHKKDQVFNKAAAVVNSGLLLMAVMGLLFPAVLHSTHTERQFGKSELALSRFSSCVMLVAYASYLVFQLKSHRTTYDPVNENIGDHGNTYIQKTIELGVKKGASQSEESVDDEVAEISKWEAIIWLAILTAWISVLSEYLVDAIKGASVAWKIPIAFISVVLLPIVGNAAEHASAIMFAMKDKLDISIGVAIGSSTQISMFGIPFCVVVGWIMGRPMDLNFQLFETATLFITVLVVAVLVQEGTSNYFKGLMLILCYLIVAASFYVHVDPPSDAL